MLYDSPIRNKAMVVKHEIKSQLAKLLATEDLIVEHKKVATAQFNVHTRVLTLPIWDKASNIVYDMLVGHEVGHALYTPDEDIPDEIPHQFVNVVEDARIEKLMKRKYGGLAKTFYKGYQELHDEDFFELEGEDISKFNLADKANLYFKIGNYKDIPFSSDEETALIDKMSKTETWEDVLSVSKELYEFCKKEAGQDKPDKELPIPEMQQQGGEADSQTHSQQAGDDGEETSPNASSTEVEEKEDGVDTEVGSFAGDTAMDVRTAESFEESVRKLVSMDAQESVYTEVPKVNLETIIASNADIHQEINRCFAMQTQADGNILFEATDADFVKFKKSSSKEVSYLVKEFECKKAADSYARASSSRTGVLDCSKLHTYKYSEDLFKKVTTFADGKNHGLIFVLDWSGSMSNVLMDTVKQLYSLIWFCKKVSIPFDVYAFTNEWQRREMNDDGAFFYKEKTPHYEAQEGQLVVSSEFHMMNILSSTVKANELDAQMKNIWRIANYYSTSWGCAYHPPMSMSLSGTPLNEALISLYQILPKFQRENNLQKVQCVVLTDGEANYLPRHSEVKRHWENEPYLGTRRIYPEVTFLRDRKLGKTYKFGYGWTAFTDMLLNNLKDNFTNTNFVGIRVIGGRDVNGFVNMYHAKHSEAWQKVMNDWKKLRSFSIKNSGYDTYFALSSNALSQDNEFEVDEGATKAKIKSAFAKSLKTKKLNKKVLGEFISLVV